VPARISVWPQASHTRMPEGSVIIRAKPSRYDAGHARRPARSHAASCRSSERSRLGWPVGPVSATPHSWCPAQRAPRREQSLQPPPRSAGLPARPAASYTVDQCRCRADAPHPSVKLRAGRQTLRCDQLSLLNCPSSPSFTVGNQFNGAAMLALL
jgi:hypothetical protein